MRNYCEELNTIFIRWIYKHVQHALVEGQGGKKKSRKKNWLALFKEDLGQMEQIGE